MEELFQKLVRENLTPNSFYVLFSIAKSIKPHTFVNSNLEITRLKQAGWLTENLQITDKSIIFIEEINGFFKKSKKKSSQIIMGTDFLKNIEQYNLIFPNIKLPSGKYARSNVKNLENAFRWFFDNYDYDWDTIFSASKKYIREYADNQYNYMRTSQYFIRKQEDGRQFMSELANYCEIILNKPVDDTPKFKERYL
jgi:hypothetical protein